MPKNWHDRYDVNIMDDDDRRDFYRSIVADKKPYFMKNIYPTLMKQYKDFVKNTNCNALREFNMTVDELRALPLNEQTDRQRDFLKYYDLKLPVGTGECVMNKICRRFEERFNGYLSRSKQDTPFDYTILRCDGEYTQHQYYTIKKLYNDYNTRLRNYSIFAGYEKIDECESFNELSFINEEFQKKCSSVCPNDQALCNLLLDMCYTKTSTKRFVWSMCGDTIIHNLIKRANNTISFPVMDPIGDILYCGNKFSIKTKEIGGIQ